MLYCNILYLPAWGISPTFLCLASWALPSTYFPWLAYSLGVKVPQSFLSMFWLFSPLFSLCLLPAFSLFSPCFPSLFFAIFSLSPQFSPRFEVFSLFFPRVLHVFFPFFPQFLPVFSLFSPCFLPVFSLFFPDFLPVFSLFFPIFSLFPLFSPSFSPFFHCFSPIFSLFSPCFLPVFQGWELSHRFSERIARFLPKNERFT